MTEELMNSKIMSTTQHHWKAISHILLVGFQQKLHCWNYQWLFDQECLKWAPSLCCRREIETTCNISDNSVVNLIGLCFVHFSEFQSM